jgi:protein-disulfide isomerase
MTTRHPDPEELMASIDGEVAADRHREIRAHLDACASCAALADQLRTSSAALAGWPVDAPPVTLSARVRQMVRQPRDAGAPASSWRSGRVRWAVLAAMVLIGITVPLRMQCVEASSMCPLDRMGHLLGTGRPPDDLRPLEAPGNVAPIAGGTGAMQDVATPREPVPAGEAKVVLTMFIDWQCPACRAAHESYLGVLQHFEQASPGAVKFILKDFPLNSACNPGVSAKPHAAACEAAVAVRLARATGREREMVEWLFANQASLTPDGVKAAFASITGANEFDLHYAEEVEHVRSDATEGVGQHVQFTPSCFLNGVLINRPGGGWLPADELRALIDRELMKGGGSQ